MCRIWEWKQAFNWITQTVDNCAFHCSDNSGYKYPYLIFVTSITSGACGEKLCHVDKNSYWKKFYILMKVVHFSGKCVNWNKINIFACFFVWSKIQQKNGLKTKMTNMRYAFCKQPPHCSGALVVKFPPSRMLTTEKTPVEPSHSTTYIHIYSYMLQLHW